MTVASGTYVAGRDSYLTFDSLNIGSALASEAGLDMSRDEVEVNVFGLDWKKWFPGISEATLAISGAWDAGTAAENLDATLFGAMGSGGTKLWEYMPQGSSANRVLYKGNGFATGFGITSPVGGVVGFALAIRASEEPARSISAG